jgi:hypothetical protein
MKRLLSGIVVACISACAADAAAVCATKAELKVLQAAALQQQLVAAALSCNYAGDYSRFVTRYRDDILKYDRALRTFFHRRQGGEGYDAYKERIAEEVSLHSLHDPGFCRNARAVFDLALQRDGASQAPPLVVTGYETCRPLPEMPVLAAKPQPAKPVLAAKPLPHRVALAAPVTAPVPKPRPVLAPATRVAAVAAPRPVKPVAAGPVPAKPVPVAAPLRLASVNRAATPLQASRAIRYPAARTASLPTPHVVQPVEAAPPLEDESFASRDDMETWSDTEAEANGVTDGEVERVAENRTAYRDPVIGGPPPRRAYAAPPPRRDAWRPRSDSGYGSRSYAFAQTARHTVSGGNVPNAYRPGAYWVRDDERAARDDRQPPSYREPPRMTEDPDEDWYPFFESPGD